MKRVASVLLPAIGVDRSLPTPLHRQIYDAFRMAVSHGDLRPGQRVPSSRELAAELKISRFPVVNAYAQLMTEGYLETWVGAGTAISRVLPERRLEADAVKTAITHRTESPRATARRMEELTPARPLPWLRGTGSFRVGEVASEVFPFKIWAGLAVRSARLMAADALQNSDAMGYPPLRSAIAEYLRTSRRLRCEDSQIMIVNGTQQALHICGLALLEPGAPIWMEEPGYGFARDALSFSRCRFIPVPVDREGLNVRQGIRMCPKAKAALVTPSHQFPLGVTMSLQRRMELLNWASSSGAWILEDDYDSEFRYESPPLACMQGLDVDARVIYLGSFSKVLFPALRIGYLVLPPDLVAAFRAIRLSVDFSRASFEQRVLTDFLAEGHFARHLRRMRLTYSERRTALVENIQRQLGADFPVVGDDAAIQLVMKLPRGFRDRELADRAAKESFWLWPLSATYFASKPQSGFVLGFGGTPAEAMPRAVSRLKTLLEGERSSSSAANRR